MSTPQRPQLSLRTPADIVTAVPYVLGFHPDDSLVVLALAQRRIRFAARIDLPTDDPAVFQVQLDQTIRVAAQHASHAILVGYGDNPRVTAAFDAARTSLSQAAIAVLDALRVTDGRFYGHDCTDPRCCPPDGSPLPQATTTVAQAVFAGMVARSSRDELASLIAPLTGEAAQNMTRAVQHAARALATQLLTHTNGHDDEVTAADQFLVGLAATTITQAADRYRNAGQLDDHEAATLLVLLRHHRAHDHALFHADASAVDLWADLTRRAPTDLVPAAATVLAWTALLAGDGGLANLALDRALAADPHDTLADALRQVAMLGGSPEDLTAYIASKATEPS